MEANIFAIHLAAMPSVQQSGQMYAQAIIDMYRSGKKVGAQDFDALYPLKNYEATTATLRKAFGASLTNNTVAVADMYGGDIQFSCSAQFAASAVAGLKSSRKAYLYLFDYTPSQPRMSLFGPTHSLDLAFVFGNFDDYTVDMSFGASQSWAATSFEQKLSNSVMDYWLNFVRYSDPNTKSTDAKWPAAGCGGDGKTNFMVFGEDGPGEAA